MHDLTGHRTDYDSVRLIEAEAPSDPLVLFDAWMTDALRAEEEDRIQEATAMTVATVRMREGRPHPSARVVLLKEFDGIGFTFYTNYESDKGEQLDAEPQAAATLWWPALFRQVRIEGSVERVARTTSEAYFAVRPRGSQLGAWASAQSRPVESAERLAADYAATEERFAEQEVGCPPHWGGFRILPETIEFWQGRPSRMHDRLKYARPGERWERIRLAP